MRGGGVLLAVKSSFQTKIINLVQVSELFQHIDGIDIVGLQVSNFNHVLYVFVVYIPPFDTRTETKNMIEGFEVFYLRYGPELLIVGDFNLPTYINSISGASTPPVSNLNALCSLLMLKQYNFVRNSMGR